MKCKKNQLCSAIYSRHSFRFRPLTYTPYGAHDRPEKNLNYLAFNGEYLEPTLKFYALGNGRRIYSSSLMRFYSSDPLSPFNKGGINSYSYCADDPINYTDPSGHLKRFRALSLFEIRPETNNTHHEQLVEFRRANPTHSNFITQIAIENALQELPAVGTRPPTQYGLFSEHYKTLEILNLTGERLLETHRQYEQQPHKYAQELRTAYASFEQDYAAVREYLTTHLERARQL